MIILWIARFFVWVTRGILWVLMMIGNAASCFLLRQMEYDADRCEIRTSGSDAFEASMKRLIVLIAARNGAIAGLQSSWQEKRLADDFPSFMISFVDKIPPEVLREIEKRANEEPTKVMATHPSDRDRIARAHQAAAKGIFHPPGPEKDGSSLLAHRDRIACDVSLIYYREVAELNVRQENLVPFKDLLEREKQEGDAARAMEEFFHGRLSTVRGLDLPEQLPQPPATRDELIAAGNAIRGQIVRDDVAYKDLPLFEKIDSRLLAMLNARALLSCRFNLDAKSFELPRADEATVDREMARVRERMEQYRGQVAPMDGRLRDRLLRALSVYGASNLPDDLRRVWGETGKLYPMLVHIERGVPLLRE